ncbi:hypothetical protein [Croceivirga thetidis]|uniref:Uncharacterized protein n=1 Tax=Croceivirga thetidis TaxID=2721623 RepID=A0ABX1GRZ2_9FLAO|nr:hypothetical protein [Croceivirga thetidis]NKI32359.1 hypothetical protein [Croceivirga thetidis]
MTTEISTNYDKVHRRLERESEAVSRLLKKTTSYRFEPKDYSCFQLLQQLRIELEELSNQQQIALTEYNSKGSIADSDIADIEELSSRFKELETNMATYLLRVTS